MLEGSVWEADVAEAHETQFEICMKGGPASCLGNFGSENQTIFALWQSWQRRICTVEM